MGKNVKVDTTGISWAGACVYK